MGRARDKIREKTEIWINLRERAMANDDGAPSRTLYAATLLAVCAAFNSWTMASYAAERNILNGRRIEPTLVGKKRFLLKLPFI